MTQAIIFDMDGTLFQTDRILELSLEDTFNHLRSLELWEGSPPIEKYREIMGVPLPKVWETLLPEHSQEVRDQVDELFLERLIMNIKAGQGALYTNVKEVMRDLVDSGYSIYIASNGLVKYLQAIVEFYGLDEFVTETFSIEQIDSLDKADLIKAIIEKYQVSKGAVVGDRLSDIHAAKKNGLLAVGCRFDFAREEELAEADVVVNDLKELSQVLQRLEV